MAANTLRLKFPPGTGRVYVRNQSVQQHFGHGTLIGRVQPLAANANFTIAHLVPGPEVLVRSNADSGGVWGDWTHHGRIGSGYFASIYSFIWLGIRNGKAECHLFDGTPIGIGTGADHVLTSPNTLSTTQCTTVAMTYHWFYTDATPHVMKLWEDGVEVASMALPTLAPYSGGPYPYWFWKDGPELEIGNAIDTAYITNNVDVALQQVGSGTFAFGSALQLYYATTEDWATGNFGSGTVRFWRLNGLADLGGVSGNVLTNTTIIDDPACGLVEPPPPPEEELSDPTPSPLPDPGTCCEPSPPQQGEQTPTPGDTPFSEGWVPQCGPSAGELSVYDIPEQMDMQGVRDPRTWLEINFKEFDAENVTTDDAKAVAIEATMIDPFDYHLGRKRADITEMSPIIKALTDEQGNYAGTQLRVKLSDKDRSNLRTRLGSTAGRFLWGKEATVHIASETVRRFYAPTRQIFRGVSTKVELEPGFSGSMVFEDIIARHLGRGQDKTFSTRRFPKVMWPFAQSLAEKPVQYIFGEVSDAGAQIPSTGAQKSKGMVPLWLMGARTYNGITYDEYHIAGSAVVDYAIYGTDNAEEKPQRVLLDLDALAAAGDFFGPHYPEWPLDGDYLDIENPIGQGGDGKIHRVTHVFFRSDHYISEAHKRGSITLAANVCGIEDVGDGTGELITDLFTQFQWIFEQLILPDEEWTSGNYPNAPMWEDGVRKLDGQSFRDAQDLTAEWIGGRGYQGGFVLGGPAEGPVNGREIIRRMTESSNARFTWTGAGMLRCVLLDDTLDFANLRHYREPSGLRAWPSPKYADEEVENPISANFDYDDDAKRYRSFIDEVGDPIAQTRMGGPRPRSEPLAMRMVRDPVTANHVVQRRLGYRKYPPCYVPAELPIDGMDHDAGDVILISSQEGTGEGFDGEPVQIYSSGYNPMTKRTSCIARALRDGNLGGPIVWDNALLDDEGTEGDEDVMTDILDPFDRADEAELESPWATTPPGGVGLALVDEAAEAGTLGAAASFWTDELAEAAEVWVTFRSVPA